LRLLVSWPQENKIEGTSKIIISNDKRFIVIYSPRCLAHCQQLLVYGTLIKIETNSD
jgi:hypothetical protein